MSDALAEHITDNGLPRRQRAHHHAQRLHRPRHPGRRSLAALHRALALSHAAVVKGRITVADEVVEKIAALAALEVAGVADLGGDLARAIESVRDRIGIGSRRGTQGAHQPITGAPSAPTATRSPAPGATPAVAATTRR